MRRKTILKHEIRLAAWVFALLMLAAGALIGQRALAQDDAGPLRSPAELEELVAPVALYPDDLLAIVLPATTYPLQIVEAARFLEDREADPGLTPDEGWDSSIVALLNYPEVVALLNEDLDWTWSLGEAVLDEQAAVLDAVQSFRTRARVAGNLESDDRQVVTDAGGVIEIAPADPEVVYIPYYEPERVIVRQPIRVYRYYDYGYPLYYYPYPVGYSFASPFFWGVTSAFAIGWHTHHVHVYHHSHIGHPYYQWRYYTPYYARRDVVVNVTVNNYRNVWQPNRRRIVRVDEGYVRGRSNRGTYSYDRRRSSGIRSQGDRTRPLGTSRTAATLDRQRTAAPRLTRNAASRDGTIDNRATATRNRTGTQSQLTRRSSAAPARTAEPSRDNALRNRTTAPARVLGGVDRTRRAQTTAPRRPARQSGTPSGGQIAGQRRVVGRAAPTNPGIAAAPRAPATSSRAPATSSRATSSRAPATRPTPATKLAPRTSPQPSARQSRAAPSGGQRRQSPNQSRSGASQGRRSRR